MFLKAGDKVKYEGFSMGAAMDTENGDVILAFTDPDNETIHMFPITVESWGKLKILIDQKMSGAKLHIAGAHELPNEEAS